MHASERPRGSINDARASPAPPALMATRVFGALLLVLPVAARWCQVETVKADIYGNFSFMGEWRVDGCTTLQLDHGYCSEQDCPSRIMFTDEQIIELADKLHGNSQLTAISLGSNLVADEGCTAIAEALRDNENLADLNLQGNQIGDQGAMALVQAMTNNVALNSINLAFNNLTDTGARALIDLLKNPESALDTLHIFNNTDVSPALMAECLDANQLAFQMPPSGMPALGEGKDEV